MSANASTINQQFNEQFYLLIKMIKGDLLSFERGAMGLMGVTPPPGALPPGMHASHFSQKTTTNVPLNLLQDQNYDPSSLVNLALNAKDEHKHLFTNLRTEQLSALVPQVRFYKAIGNDYKPFYFPNNTHPSEVEQITSDGGRLQGAGIKSFNVDFEGSNPFSADKTLKCTLIVYVQNMNSLFSDPPLAGDYAKLAELITIPPSSRGKNRKAADGQVKVKGQRAVDSSQVEQSNNFEIAADVGWAVYPEMNKLFSRAEMRAVESNRMTLRMTLFDHSLVFEQDGTLTITAQYTGRLETVFEQKTSDVLLDVNMLSAVNNQLNACREKNKDISVESVQSPEEKNTVCEKPQKLLASQLVDILSRLDATPETTKIHNISLSREDEEAFFKEAREGPQQSADTTPTKGESSGATEKKAEAAAAAAPSAEDNPLIDIPLGQLTALVKYRGLERKVNRLIKKCDMMKDHLAQGSPPSVFAGPNDHCKKLDEAVNEFGTTPAPDGYSNKAANAAEAEIERRANAKDAAIDKQVTADPAVVGADALIAEKCKKDPTLPECKKNTSACDDQSKVGKPEKRGTKKTEAPPKRTPESEAKSGEKKGPVNLASRNIHFFYLADLFEVVLQKLLENHQGVDDEQIKRQLETFRIILGTVKLKVGEKETLVSIGDIPITVRAYSYWFMDKVVRPGKTRYGFRNFMKDVMSSLVFNSIRGMSYRDAPMLDNKTNFGSIVMTSEDKGEKIKNKTVITVKDIPTFTSKTARGNIYDVVDYIIFYSYEKVTAKKPLRVGDPAEDQKNGIPHLYLGLDRGIIKDIKFKKNDVMFRKEMLISKAVKLFDELRMPYDADISMIGNTLFLPGSQFYINPLTVGLGDPRNVNSAAVRLGLGGYYTTITVSTQFDGSSLTTNLSSIFEAPPGDKANAVSPHSGLSPTDPILGSTLAPASPDTISPPAAAVAPAGIPGPAETVNVSLTEQADLISAEVIARKADQFALTNGGVFDEATQASIATFANGVLDRPWTGTILASNYDNDNDDYIILELDDSGERFIFDFRGPRGNRSSSIRRAAPPISMGVTLGGV